MRIPITKLPLQTPLLQLPSKQQLLDNLRPGQIFPATALSENRNGNVRLQIGATELTAHTQLPVRPGQPLLLQVNGTDPLPELKLVMPLSQKQLQASAFRQVLPRQQPLSRLFEKLIDSNVRAGEKPLPETVRQEIQVLLSRIPSTESLDFRRQFRDALLQSGVLSEAHLIHGRSCGSDMKQNLLKLIALVQSLLPQQKLSKGQVTSSQEPSNTPAREPSVQKLLIDLHKQLDGALARIQMNQLCSLPPENPTGQIWQFELPMRQGDQVDLFQIRVKRERPSSDDDEAVSWDLILRMNLVQLGSMRIQLRLLGNVVSTLVWSENIRTTKLVTDNLTELRTAFERAGLEVKKMAAFTAKVEDEMPLPDDISLLSEKA